MKKTEKYNWNPVKNPILREIHDYFNIKRLNAWDELSHTPSHIANNIFDDCQRKILSIIKLDEEIKELQKQIKNKR